jgi:hypothetical protein
VALAVLDFHCLAGDPLNEHALLLFRQLQPGDVVIAPTSAWQHLVAPPIPVSWPCIIAKPFRQKSSMSTN